MCELSCKAYAKGLSSENLIAGFRKTGIYPTDKDAIDKVHLIPADIFRSDPTNEPEEDTTDERECEPPQSPVEPVLPLNTNSPQDNETTEKVNETNCVERDREHSININIEFFENKLQTLKKVKSGKKKARRSVSNIVSGKPITEDNIHRMVKDYESTRKQPLKKKQPAIKGDKNKSKCIRKQKVVSVPLSPQPGPSNTNMRTPDLQSDSEMEIVESEKCCVCKKFTPDEVRDAVSLIFVKWAQCDRCEKWVHLVYCTPVKVIRRSDNFVCPHCQCLEE